MKKILITGATGKLGTKTIDYLLENKKIEKNRIVALVRSESKAKALQEKGIELRVGTYDDKESLELAFKDIDKVLLISSPELDNKKRLTQQFNAVISAKNARVNYIVFVGVADPEKNVFGLENIDLATEYMIKSLGFKYTFMRNGVYLDELKENIKLGFETGVLKSITKDKPFNYVLREDLALANSKVLIEDNHENKIYTLVSSNLLTYSKIADVLAELKKSPVKNIDVKADEAINDLLKTNLNKEAAEMIVNLFQLEIANEKFTTVTNDLDNLIGKRTLEETLIKLLKI